MYTLLVCADIYGEKCNLELNFSSAPTIAELQRRILLVFSSEAGLRQPREHPPIEFSIARIQVYDDGLLQWVDLVSQMQLHEYDQLYVFQPQTAWHKDVQKDLPPPRPPLQCSVARPESGSGTSYNMAGATITTPASASYRQGVSCASACCGAGLSPTKLRLEEQRRLERLLEENLARVREESERLAHEASIEDEENRLREQAYRNRFLLQKECEVSRHRDLLMRSEEELYRLKSEETLYRH